MRVLIFTLTTFFFIPADAQDKYNLLEGRDWLLLGNEYHKHYLFSFSHSIIQAEEQDYWKEYLVEGDLLIVYTLVGNVYFEDNTIKRFPKWMRIKGSDSAIFEINSLTKDSLILWPKNKLAKNESYRINLSRAHTRFDSTNYSTLLVKMFNRKLTYKDFRYDSLRVKLESCVIRIDSNGNYRVTNKKRKQKVKGLSIEANKELHNLISQSDIEYFRTASWKELRNGRNNDLTFEFWKSNDSTKLSFRRFNIPWTFKSLYDFFNNLNSKR